MGGARICGTVVCEELADGPLSVSAHSEPAAGQASVASTALAGGPGDFSLDVPAGTWWLRATLQQDAPGPRAVSAWSREAVTVAEGEEILGVEIVVEVPEQVR
jgi:hypothetical protein